MKNFEYTKAKTLEEAITFLAENGEKARILAGGTDILVKLKQKKIAPDILIDIKGVSGLDGIELHSEGGMKIGSLTTIREIGISPEVRKHLPALADAAQGLGSVQVRHRATIGGNLCSALPSADMGPYLIGMGARVVVVGPGGERKLLVDELFADSGRNSLQIGEVVVAIEIPPWTRYTGGAYIKLAVKNAVDVAMVAVSAVVVTDRDKKVFEDGRIVLGAVGPRPIRALGAEEYLRGKRTEERVIAMAGESASKEARPRTTMEYKTQMVGVLTRRAIKEALQRISEG